MDLASWRSVGSCAWEMPPQPGMRVPAIVYGTAELVGEMDEKVGEQLANVARLPGIVAAAWAMPDAHWGYGFPIGGVAAFDPDAGGVVSAGGVGFDIACGVRLLLTGVGQAEVESMRVTLADALFEAIPAGVGSTGDIRLEGGAMDAMLTEGARWAVAQGWGVADDLARIEGGGVCDHADPAVVGARARARQRDEIGTLGSGNHYLEVQRIDAIADARVAEAWGLRAGEVVVSLHCGSRGLGHQIGAEFLLRMAAQAGLHGIALPDRELACAPIRSALGAEYLGAMGAAINCALANRQILTHRVREVFARLLPRARLELLYDVSHNTCRRERHAIDGREREVYVHRKGATRALGPGHAELPPALRETGQPVLVGGSMGTASWVLVGTADGERRALASACHGAGRAMSRHRARQTWRGRALVDELARRGIVVRSPSSRGVAEEAPGAYKDVDGVVEAAQRAGLARRVARLTPIVTLKG